MDQSAHFITVATADLDAARQFYVAGLGWSPLLDVEGEIVFFQIAPGVVLGLFEAEHFVQDLGGAAGGLDHTRPAGLTFSHNVQSRGSVDQLVGAAVEAGGTLVKSPQETSFGGYHGHFADPNGVLWEICHNPGWSVDAEGVVALS